MSAANWYTHLSAARERGDFDAALQLRRQDAEHFGFNPRLALDEERRWWTENKLRANSPGSPSVGLTDQDDARAGLVTRPGPSADSRRVQAPRRIEVLREIARDTGMPVCCYCLAPLQPRTHHVHNGTAAKVFSLDAP